MRIIAGKFRGRPILAPGGDATRPITDRVKQSLFDILTPLLPEARVYDCFAGTGSMGLESLSRGAAHVTFFETDRSAIARLKKNVQTLGVAGRSRIVAEDVFRWVGIGRSANVPRTGRPGPSPCRLAGVPGRGEDVSLIFLDPPYRLLRERAEDLRGLAERMAREHLTADGTVVFRHDGRDTLELPSLWRYDQRSYGNMTLEFLHPRL